MTNFTLTEENTDEFLEAYYAGTHRLEVDLMAANPDVRSQVRQGWFTVRVVEMEMNGETLFVAHADDGSDGGDLEDEMVICADLIDAKVAADSYIMDWKRNWDLCI